MSAEVKTPWCPVCAGDGDISGELPCRACLGTGKAKSAIDLAHYELFAATRDFERAQHEVIETGKRAQEARRKVEVLYHQKLWPIEEKPTAKATPAHDPDCDCDMEAGYRCRCCREGQAQKKKRDGEEGCD